MRYGAFKGATHYEAFIGHLWIMWPYWRFMRLGIWPKIGYTSWWERDE